MVKEVWESTYVRIYHAAISHKGYHQTVPLPLLAVPIYMKNLRRDLRDIAQHRLGHIRIRDDAEGMVEEMRAAGQVPTFSERR